MHLILAIHPAVAALGALLHAAILVACLLAARPSSLHRLFWRGLALAHALMAADSALGLRTLVAAAGRAAVQSEGWYKNRRPAQALACALGVAVVVLLTIHIRRWFAADISPAGKSCRAALAGTALSLTMLVLSTISLHYIDSVVTWPSTNANVGILVRAISGAITFAAAVYYIRLAATTPAQAAPLSTDISNNT